MRTPLIDRFNRCVAGGMAVTFAVALPMLALAVGGGIDVSNALTYRQKLANALELGCQQAATEVNYQVSQNQVPNVQSIVNTMTTQKIADAGLSSTASETSTATPPTISITGTGNSSAAFAQLLNRTGFPIKVNRQCLYGQANQVPPAGTPLFTESFEVNHNVAQNSWTVLGYNGNKTSGNSWNGWTTQNAGIEINGMPQLSGGTIRFGNFFAELDSDCLGASPCHSNSTMSRIVTLQPNTTYTISYWYISRVTDSNISSYGISVPSNYGSTVHCNKDRLDDLVNPLAKNVPYDPNWAGQTNRIEVFAEPPNHRSFDVGDIVDVCVYSDHWTERKDIQIVTPLSPATQDWRISWRAAGKEDTFGGLIDYLRMCKGTCP